MNLLTDADLIPEGCELGLSQTCENGWKVQQIHIFGTGPEVQESLLGTAELARPEKKKPRDHQ